METLIVKVINWDKYNKVDRKVKHPRWFALNNRVLEDPELFGLDDQEFRAFIYVLSQASQKNNPVVRLVLAHAEKVCSVNVLRLKAMIAKLPNVFEIVGAISGNAQAKPGKAETTLQDITVHDSTEQDTTVHGNNDNNLENENTNPYQEPETTLVTEILKKAFNGLVPPSIERMIPEISQKFKTAENFRAWFLDLWNSDKAHKDKNVRWRSYITGAIRNELQGTEKCLKSLSLV